MVGITRAEMEAEGRNVGPGDPHLSGTIFRSNRVADPWDSHSHSQSSIEIKVPIEFECINFLVSLNFK